MEKLLDKVVSALLDLKIVEIGVLPAHIFLCKRDREILFGKGTFLHEERPLAQIGKFASEERVTLLGTDGSKRTVPVYGPDVKETKVFLTQMDCSDLGVDPSPHSSGYLEGAAPITLEGPAGRLYLQRGAVLIRNTVCMKPETAKRLGLEDGEKVKVRFETEDPVTLSDVIINIDRQSVYMCFIASDIAGVAGIDGTAFGRIIRGNTPEAGRETG